MVYLYIFLYFNIIFMKDESTSLTYVCSSESAFIGGGMRSAKFYNQESISDKRAHSLARKINQRLANER